MKQRLVRWSARLERAALAFARSWVEDGAAAKATALVAANAARAGGEGAVEAPSPAGAAWSADDEGPPEDWLRYVTARSQAADGSRVYAPGATERTATERAASSRLASPPSVRRLAAWARARLSLPELRPAASSEPPRATPADAAGDNHVAPGTQHAPGTGHGATPPGMRPRPVRSLAAAPLAPAPASAGRPGVVAAPEASRLSTGARPARAAASARPLAPALPAPPRSMSSCESAAPSELPHARLAQRAEVKPRDARLPQRTSLPLEPELEPAAPAAPRMAPAARSATPATSALETQASPSRGAWPSDAARLEAMPSRPREPAALPRARARAGRVEVTELAPRLRLRASPEPARAEPPGHAVEPPAASPPRAARAAGRAPVQTRGDARAELLPSAAALTPPRAASAGSLAAVPHVAASPSRAAAPPPAGAVLARRAPQGTEPCLPARFPELPRPGAGATLACPSVDAWPELPPSPPGPIAAQSFERRNQLLREQSEV